MLLHGVVDIATSPPDVVTHAMDGAAAASETRQQESCSEEAKHDPVVRFHKYFDFRSSEIEKRRVNFSSRQQSGIRG
jgi:hypothetical protein